MLLPSSIRDGSPDAWGRRVIINSVTGLKGDRAAQTDLDELSYLLESGSDCIGMLDFQRSPTDYAPRQRRDATLAELMESAERVEKGVQLTVSQVRPSQRMLRELIWPTSDSPNVRDCGTLDPVNRE